MATIRGLFTKYKAQSEAIREELVFKGCVTREELEPYWPGGSENPGKDIEAWIYCYASMVRFCDRLGALDFSDTAVRDERLVLDALRGEPATVTLTEPIAEKKSLKAYPKSMSCLLDLAGRDEVLRLLSLAHIAFNVQQAEDPTAERAEQLGRVMAEIAHQHSMCVWTVTTPGPGLPYTSTDDAPTPPSWTGLLSPVDVIFVLRAHHEVNAVRLAALRRLIDVPDDDGTTQAPSWAVYFGSVATELGVKSEELMRDWSLGAVLASSHVSAGAKAAQMERAKNQADAS